MKKLLAFVLFFVFFFSSLFIFFAKFPPQQKTVLAQTCQDGDRQCPGGCNPANDNDCMVSSKVFLLIFNPIIESEDSKKLTEVLGWNNPDPLIKQYINDVKEASGNFVTYEVVNRLEVDAFVKYTDGFIYDDNSYLEAWYNQDFDHGDAGRDQPMSDYQAILQEYEICEKLNQGEIDELWMFAFPYSGFWESALAGPGAFQYNSPPVMGTTCEKLLPIMGFNYERGVSEMLEDFGHRVEATMKHVYGSWQNDEDTPWNKFTLYDRIMPGKANCGRVHFAPNSIRDYDWGNTNPVRSFCDDWYNYPNLQGKHRTFNCDEWGCDGYGFHKWWLKHLPRVSGLNEGKLNNWWWYVLDYDSASKEGEIEGDLNGDKVVDIQDLRILLENWEEEVLIPKADFNSDNIINEIDFGMLRSKIE